VLFFRPNKDIAMQFASEWLGAGVEEATKRGYNVIDIVDEACTFETLKATIESEKPTVIILGGHGNSTTFTGYEQQIVFQACSGDEIMSGTISHFLSCLVAQELLPSIIKKKGVWTLGYQTTFDFMIDPPEAVTPFRDITLAVITKMLDGGKLKEVWDAGIKKGEEWIAKLWNRSETWCAETIQCIDKDIHGMIGLGNGEAYVLPPRRVMAGLSLPQLLGLAALFVLVTGRKTVV